MCVERCNNLEEHIYLTINRGHVKGGEGIGVDWGWWWLENRPESFTLHISLLFEIIFTISFFSTYNSLRYVILCVLDYIAANIK